MSGELVLIVEDNERSLKLARDVLQFRGYQTLEATTAEDAIALAHEHVPQLILMDIHLPGMDGVTALGRLRADPATASIPVVALTASAMTQDRERFVAEGFDGYLDKPIDVKRFHEQVGEFIKHE